MPQEFDDHILSTMTDEERAAITEEPTPEEVAAIEAVNTGADEGPDDDEDDAPEVETAATDKANEPAPATEAKADPGSVVEPDAQPENTNYQENKLPQYSVESKTDTDNAIKVCDEAIAQLQKQFTDGEIDFQELSAAQVQVYQKRTELLISAATENSLRIINEQNQIAENKRFVDRFIASVSADGIDYNLEKNIKLFNTVEEQVREENPTKDKAWIWAEAHKIVAAARGIQLTKPNDVVSKPDVKTSRKSPLDAAPKTLAQVPGGDGPGDVDGNEFADIDRLKGDAYEAAIAKMSPSTRERYLASA